MSLGSTACSGSYKSLAMDLEVECRKKLERQAQVRPEGPGRPNERMDFIHKSKISYQIILSSFRCMTVSSQEGGCEESRKRPEETNASQLNFHKQK